MDFPCLNSDFLFCIDPFDLIESYMPIDTFLSALDPTKK